MAERKVFHDSVVPLPHDGTHAPLGLVVQSATAPALEEPLTVHFSFTVPGQADLEARVAAGKLSPRRSRRRNTVRRRATSRPWKTGQGFTITHVAPDGIYAQAPASQVAKSLDVDMVRVTREGFTHNAARNAPSLPADIAKNVRAIGGLQPFLRAYRHNRKRTPKASNRVSLGADVHGMRAASGGPTDKGLCHRAHGARTAGAAISMRQQTPHQRCRRARRRQVVEMIVMETNRLHQARDSRVQRMLRTTLKTLAAQLAELE
jgi:hypothetical protein